MLTFLIALLSVILIIVVYYIIKRIRRNSALKILLNHSQQVTDKMIVLTLKDPKMHYDSWLIVPESIHSNPVQDVWGKGIMVFEYKFPITKNFQNNTDVFNDKFIENLQKNLNIQAADNGVISSVPKYDPFIISDHWVLKDEFHFDIAFMTSEPTIEYVKDVRRAAKR